MKHLLPARRLRTVAALLLLTVFTSSVTTFAQTKPADAESTQAVFLSLEEVTEFLDLWANGVTVAGANKSFQMLTRATWSDEVADVGEGYAASFARYEQSCGKLLGAERVSVEKRGESIANVSYLFKFERTVLVLHIIAYKPKDEWHIFTFTYDNDGPFGLFGIDSGSND